MSYSPHTHNDHIAPRHRLALRERAERVYPTDTLTSTITTHMAEAELQADHGGFLNEFVRVAAEGDGINSHDGNGAGISKRQKKLVHVNTTSDLTAPVARYALGGDDNLYLQLGLSVLHTASPNQALAPAALYNVDVVHAIRDGIKRNLIADLERRKTEAPTKLEQVRLRLSHVFHSGNFDATFNELGPLNSLHTPYSPSKHEDFNKMLKRLHGILKSELARSIEKSFAAGNGSTGAPAVVHYALARGLCGHRGPMEESTGHPTDRLLPYAAPKDIGVQLARAKGMRVPDGAWTPPIPAHDSTEAVEEAMAAFGGNYAIDAIDDAAENGKSFGVVRDARQVRWEPVGEHAVALATAAALEHAVARCTQLLDDPRSTLSEHAKCAITRARVCLKLVQLDSFHELACAAEDGKVLHQPPSEPMVTRPTTTIRGKLHFAHDAGHHPAPTMATVLADRRWTPEHARADAAFRNSTNTAGSASIAVYKAPAPHELGYLPIMTGAPAAISDLPVDPSDEDYRQRTIISELTRIVEYGLYYADIPDVESIKATLNDGGADPPTDALGSAVTRRSGIWNEMLRDIAVSTDRLWTFVRTLSGLIGEDADSLLVTADDASVAAAKDIQAQRKATVERIANFQTKIVESLISSMMKDSGLRLDTAAEDAGESLVVVNAETAKQIHDLASGESGRPFFEANVALRALADKNKGGKHTLGAVVAQLNGVMQNLHTALEAQLISPQTAGASLAELSLPRNSYFVKLRDDTTAALRSAYDKFTVEASIHGMGRICLWELIEGADHTLCTRFAEFVGHILIQNRTSTGVSALYASRQQLVVNASQAGNALQRLLNHAGHYRRSYPHPNFNPNGQGEKMGDFRIAYFQQHTERPSTWATSGAIAAIRYAQDRHYKHVERVFRPADQTPDWLKEWTHQRY